MSDEDEEAGKELISHWWWRCHWTPLGSLLLQPLLMTAVDMVLRLNLMALLWCWVRDPSTCPWRRSTYILHGSSSEMMAGLQEFGSWAEDPRSEEDIMPLKGSRLCIGSTPLCNIPPLLLLLPFLNIIGRINRLVGIDGYVQYELTCYPFSQLGSTFLWSQKKIGDSYFQSFKIIFSLDKLLFG